MKKSRSKIKSKNLFKNIIKAHFIISATLFFIVCKGWCQESVGQTKNKDKVIVHAVNAVIPTADFIEYFLTRPTSIPSSITQKAIDQWLYEMIITETLYKEVMRKNVYQNSDIRLIILQIFLQKLIKEKMERDAWARPIEEENFQAYYEQHKYEFSRLEQVCLTDLFILLYLNTLQEQRIERLKKGGNIY